MYVHVYLIKYVFENYVISANHVGGGGVQKTHYTACVNHLLLRTVLQDDNIKASTQGGYTVWLPWGD